MQPASRWPNNRARCYPRASSMKPLSVQSEKGLFRTPSTGSAAGVAATAAFGGAILGSGLEFPHWLDGFGPGFRHEQNGTPFVAKRFAQFTAEVLHVLVGEKLVAVYEQQEGGWR